MSLNRCLFAEFLGTFLLVLFGCGSVVTNEVFDGAVTLVGVALAFGLIIMVVIDTLGAVSGAHINPAVSVGLAAAGLFQWKRVVPYVAVQCLGAFAASYFHAEVIVPERPSTLAATVPRTVDGDFREAESWTVEFTLTAILMLVILRVATGPKERQAGAGLTIGMTVACMVLAFGPVNGASMNPARSLGPAVGALVAKDYGVAAPALTSLWIYWSAPFAGAVVATLVWRACLRDGPPADDAQP